MSDKDSNIERICAYCEHSVPVYGEETVLCKLRGIVGKAYHCRKFEYDPLKRIPSAAIKPPELEFIDIEKDI